MAAADAGKHILFEKPIGMNVVEVQETVEAVEKRGVTLMSPQSGNGKYF